MAKKDSKAKKGAEVPQEEGAPKEKPVLSRKDLLNKALAEVRKETGKGSVLMVGTEAEEEPIALIREVYSFGIPQMDRASNAGGLPKGKIVEIYGNESTGKTTTCLLIAAEAEKNLIEKGIEPSIHFIDAERSLEETHVKNCGIRNMYVYLPDCGEEALEYADKVCEAADIIIIDSVAALTPRDEIEGDMGEAQMGKQARLMSQACRKLVAKAATAGCTIIFTNQIRMKIGVMFGNPETTTGGNALRFYASVRIHTSKGEVIKDGEEIVGTKIKCKFIKNKNSRPYGNAEFSLLFDPQKTKVANTLEFGTDIGVITKSGTWYSYKDTRLGQGVVNTTKFLIDNPEIFNQISADVKDQMFKPIVKLEAPDAL